MNVTTRNVLAIGAGAVLAAAGTAAGLIAHDRNVVDKLDSRKDRNEAVNQFSSAIDTIGWVGLAGAMLVPASNPALAAVRMGGWGIVAGNYAAKSITESVVLNRVEDKGNKFNPFDNKLTVGPSGH